MITLVALTLAVGLQSNQLYLPNVRDYLSNVRCGQSSLDNFVTEFKKITHERNIQIIPDDTNGTVTLKANSRREVILFKDYKKCDAMTRNMQNVKASKDLADASKAAGIPYAGISREDMVVIVREYFEFVRSGNPSKVAAKEAIDDYVSANSEHEGE